MAWKHRNDGWGLPMGMVLGTVAFWYHGDALYNDYENYRTLMGDDSLAAGWWQVLLFIVALGLLTPLMHRYVNHRYLPKRSHIILYLTTSQLDNVRLQKKIDQLFKVMLITWLILMGIAIFRTNYNVMGMFAPYLTEKAYPWYRSRIGGGISALLSLAGYVQIFLTAGFGVIAAVSRNPKTRAIAVVICCLSFPFYIFDRVRNAMIATMLPGLLAWVMFRVKGGYLVKGLVLLIAFLFANFWFAYVVENRSDGSVSHSFRTTETIEVSEDVKHGGLSMFSELGYINSFMKSGAYRPNWGSRYFAELTNPIPRALWKGKPTVGVDYSIARGFGSIHAHKLNAGITTSIATGMIGQGIVNFGRLLGPIAAAFLMSLWVSVLARQDLKGDDPARLLLYAVGMILTFNMGRDITFLVLYPYIFGSIILLGRDWYQTLFGSNSMS